MNEALYGHNQDEGIVCVDVWGDTITEFIQTVDGRVVSNENSSFRPWYITHTLNPNLNGNNHFNTLNRTSMKEFKSLYEKREHIEDMLLVGNKADNYLIECGKTLFKGMTFDEVHTLGFDIETTGLNPDIHEVKMISMVDNRGFSKVIYDQDEYKVLTEFIEVFNRLDASIILQFNGFRFDIPFLMKRCQIHGIELAIGRNHSIPFESKIMVRMGTGQQDFQQAWRIWGRQCIDLYYSVIKFDTIDRSLNNYKLKNVISQYGLEKEGRVHVGYTEIFEALESGNETKIKRIIQYCLDDSEDLIKLHRYICQADFYMTQMIPMNYQRLMYSGSVGRFNNIMIRDYLNNYTSIPVWKNDNLTIEGGAVEANEIGIFKYVGDSDITSMYPNLMIQNNRFPKNDILHTMKRILVDLKDSRIALKKQMKATENGVEKNRLNGYQNAMKVLINSAFGILSSPGFYWRDNEQCAFVTKDGRELVRKMKAHIESLGYRVVALDTDGVAYTNELPIDINMVNDQIQSFLPYGIDVESKMYKGIAIFKKRTYATYNLDGTVSFKGAAITSSSTSPLVKQFIYKSIGLLFKIKFNEESFDSLKAYYDLLLDDINNNRLPIELFTMIQRVKKDTTEYNDLKDTKTLLGNTRAKLPLYELILETNRKLNIGDKTETYWAVKDVPKPLTPSQLRKKHERSLMIPMFEIPENPKTVKVKTLKWLDQYNPAQPDIFIEYYLNSLNSRIEELLGLIISKEDFNYSFSSMKSKNVATIDMIPNFNYKDYHCKYSKEWKRITLEDEFEIINKSGVDIYTTIQRFANPTQLENEMVYHPIYFDIDSINLQNSLTDTQYIVKIFTNYLKINPKYITIWFSGSKGFHIEICPEVFGIVPMTGLTLINKEIALWLVNEYKIQSIDIGSIYSNRRMWRVPFSTNSKSNYKKTWIPDILTYEDIDDLIKYIEIHQDVQSELTAYTKWINSFVPKVDLNIKKWFQTYVDKYKYDLAKEVIRKPSWKYKKLNGKNPNCIEFLRMNSISKAGDRNNATVTLLTFFKESGVSLEKAIENLVNWTQRIPEGLTSTTNYGIIKKNVESIAKRIYKDTEFGKNYVFECGYIKSLIKGRDFECPTTCILKE